MKKSITLKRSAVGQRSVGTVKEFLKNISPFNNKTDMPAVLFVAKKLIVFAVCYWSGLLLAEGIIIGGFFACGKNFLQGEMFSDDIMMLIKLYGMIVVIAVSVLYWKLTEKRKLSEMGVTKSISGWFIGAGIGVLLIIVIVSAIMVTGAIRFNGFSADINIKMFLLMLGGYAIQGAAEEFLCRGLVFGALKDRVSMPVAVGAGALVFVLPHMATLADAEPMFVILGVLNLVAVSCLFSFITLRTKSIWAACGLHSLWNFALECVCGLTVSGNESSSSALINMRAAGENFLNGGKYGIEASAVTIIIVTAVSGIILYTIKKEGREA
ncbi:MAG: CPBP family intramembrane metalloprotease [Ruminococcus sp.]|nr:CPBP family intramembrane metalloprotease [Ruminococcus sp.]